ncbi:MAG: glucose-6-phosphate dehydrogenase [Deltaproteobacteria bacterium]|nr:MAG: glucose-6-phosphate dehydrogenase [Deltaproteobacteria bacterium]
MQEHLCIEQKPDPASVVIFGGWGDLTKKKLLPSLFNLYKKKLLPEKFYAIGVLSYLDSPATDEDYRYRAFEVLGEGGDEEAFSEKLHYVPGRYDDPATYKALADKLSALDKANGEKPRHIFYLAVPPAFFPKIIKGLSAVGLTAKCPEGKTHCPIVVVEKPFGQDLASAKALASELRGLLDEDQIYRIDHYLGKETVQNILMLRFANAIFEPLWNNKYIEHIQITVSEDIGVGSRAGYYDKAGCLRDMFQNHMLQILSLITMEPPAVFEAERYRQEKFQLLKAIRPFDARGIEKWIVRGQYEAGEISGADVAGYLEEEGIDTRSNTETFVAMKVMVDNWRWAGVPFYLRSGKRMKERVSEVAVYFKRVPHSIFPMVPPEMLTQNLLVLNIQPLEGISLTLEAKRPGPKACLGALTLDFDYRTIFGVTPPEPYERLLLDAMLGDQSLFISTDGLEAAWMLLDPVLKNWVDGDGADLHRYEAGSWGPDAANELIKRDGFFWRTS